MTTLSLLGSLFALLSGSCATATLVPPFNQGVVVKVSEQLIVDIARTLTDKAVEEIKDFTFSGTIYDRGVKYQYWNLQFQDLSLTPAIDITKQAGRDRLILDGTAQGDFRATASWKVTKKIWFYTAEFDGLVSITSSGFGVKSRVIMGENDEGHVGFTHDPTYCTLDIGDFNMDFSGTSLSWIINLFVSFFEDEIRTVLEQYVCLEINEKVAEGARELDTAIFDRYDVIYVLGHRIDINNRPWIVTGGDSCAVVGALGGIDIDMPDRQEENTEPFIPPTVLTLPPILVTEKPKEVVSSFFFTSSYTPLWVDQRDRTRREAVNWCDVLPGAGRGVSVIITEEMIERIAGNLHDIRLIDFRATQDRGTTVLYNVVWGGKSQGEKRIRTANQDLLRDFDVTFRITSTDPPNVTIDRDGVAVFCNLRARVTLQSERSIETRIEIHTTVKFLGRCHVSHQDGVYALVPTFTGNADIKNAKIDIGGIGGFNLPDNILQEIEEQANKMLAQTVPELIREELKTGLPLNIPNNLIIQLTDATVEYREDYILITVEDVEVDI